MSACGQPEPHARPRGTGGAAVSLRFRCVATARLWHSAGVVPARPVAKLPFPAAGKPARDYLPRRPERSILYGAVRSQLETFVERQRRRERPLPRFVERELRAFLGCGILANGFLRVHCDACGKDRLVAFSCKGRGFCSSCGGRRMADTAAHLVDRVLPFVPVRQWVLSLPVALRYRLAYDAPLAAEVLRVFVRAVFGSLRRRAWNRHGVRQAQGGAVTFVQRFGGALNLNVHFHTLALDGVYVSRSGDEIRFYVLPPPGDDEVMRVTTRVARGIARLLERRGLGPHVDPSTPTRCPRRNRYSHPSTAHRCGAGSPPARAPVGA